MRIAILSFIGILFFVSCGKYEPAKAAFFIQPGEIRVEAGPGQGSGSHKITDLWLYVNNQFQGVYPADGRLPVMTDGAADIQIRAGIKNNGISTTRLFWPMYDFLRIDTVLPSGVIATRPLTFRYLAATTFTWVEDFDNNPGIGLKRSAISDTTYSIASPSESFEGRSIELALNTSGLIGQLESSQEFTLPRNNGNVYLELNYKCNASFEVGVIDSDLRERDAVIITPQATWNKIYVQLASVVSAEPFSPRFRVYFRIDKRDAAEPRLFLDNLKLVFLA
jgi:hypothetical protein